jgi:hypothetical protein
MERINDLNGDLRSIAEVIGRQNALYLVNARDIKQKNVQDKGNYFFMCQH